MHLPLCISLHFPLHYTNWGSVNHFHIHLVLTWANVNNSLVSIRLCKWFVYFDLTDVNNLLVCIRPCKWLVYFDLTPYSRWHFVMCQYNVTILHWNCILIWQSMCRSFLKCIHKDWWDTWQFFKIMPTCFPLINFHALCIHAILHHFT